MTRRQEPRAGQKWGIWIYDDGMYEKLLITMISHGCVYGRTRDGNRCVVGLSRLIQEGEPLNDDWSPKMGEGERQ